MGVHVFLSCCRSRSSAFSVFLVFVPLFCFFLAGRCLLFSVARVSVLADVLPCFFSAPWLVWPFPPFAFYAVFTALSLGSLFWRFFCSFSYPNSLRINFPTLSAHQIAIRTLFGQNSSELSAHQMACQCCSLRSSCFPAVLVFFFAFFFSFATLARRLSLLQYVFCLPSSLPGCSSSFSSSAWCTASSCAPWLRAPSTCCWTSGSAPAVTSKFFMGACGLLEGTAESTNGSGTPAAWKSQPGSRVFHARSSRECWSRATRKYPWDASIPNKKV